MWQFLMQLKNSKKLSQKTEFLAHFIRFLNYTLLRPMGYTPIVCQVTDLIKTNIIVISFISIRFVVAEIKIFKVLRTNSVSIKLPFFGNFWALTLPSIVVILLELSLSLHFWSNFESRFSLKMAKIKEINCSTETLQSYHSILELARPLCFPADIYRWWCKLNFGPRYGSGEL